MNSGLGTLERERERAYRGLKQSSSRRNGRRSGGENEAMRVTNRDAYIQIVGSMLFLYFASSTKPPIVTKKPHSNQKAKEHEELQSLALMPKLVRPSPTHMSSTTHAPTSFTSIGHNIWHMPFRIIHDIHFNCSDIVHLRYISHMPLTSLFITITTHSTVLLASIVSYKSKHFSFI